MTLSATVVACGFAFANPFVEIGHEKFLASKLFHLYYKLNYKFIICSRRKTWK